MRSRWRGCRRSRSGRSCSKTEGSRHAGSYSFRLEMYEGGATRWHSLIPRLPLARMLGLGRGPARPRLGHLHDTGRNDGADQTGFLHAYRAAALLLFVASQWSKKRVCTMCTPWTLERVVLVPDWAGLRRFTGEWRKFKGWSPVRVPPRARVFPVQGLVGL